MLPRLVRECIGRYLWKIWASTCSIKWKLNTTAFLWVFLCTAFLRVCLEITSNNCTRNVFDIFVFSPPPTKILLSAKQTFSKQFALASYQLPNVVFSVLFVTSFLKTVKYWELHTWVKGVNVLETMSTHAINHVLNPEQHMSMMFQTWVMSLFDPREWS